MTPEQRADALVARVGEAILHAVALTPMGCPDGVLFAHLQAILGEGWSLEVHTAMVTRLVTIGALTNNSHLLRITQLGQAAIRGGK